MNMNKKMTFRAGLLLAAALFLIHPFQACAGAMGEAGGPAGQGVSGKVVETMNSGGYTYALVAKDGAKTWVALPQSAIAVGNVIACQPGMEMTNFKSPSLNRTFESIIFSAGLAPVGPVAAPTPGAAAAPAAAPTEAITVSKAEGAEAQTIGEIFEKKDSLANKPVAVQGKVVKISRGILGKNWLHLQDGTGNQAARTNDLVVTTAALPEVGTVVTIKGNLSLNRDFGAGYRYDVIVEDAEVIGTK